MSIATSQVCGVSGVAAIQTSRENRKVLAERLLRDAVADALDAAADQGAPRKAVADRLGVSVSTVYSFSRAGTRLQFTAVSLCQLLTAQVLPAAARAKLWAKLGQVAGMIVSPVEQCRADTAPPTLQVCEIAAAMGKLGDVVAGVRDAHGRCSTMSGEQRRAALVAARELQREVGELCAALEEMDKESNGQMVKGKAGQR